MGKLPLWMLLMALSITKAQNVKLPTLIDSAGNPMFTIEPINQSQIKLIRISNPPSPPQQPKAKVKPTSLKPQQPIAKTKPTGAPLKPKSPIPSPTPVPTAAPTPTPSFSVQDESFDGLTLQEPSNTESSGGTAVETEDGVDESGDDSINVGLVVGIGIGVLCSVMLLVVGIMRRGTSKEEVNADDFYFETPRITLPPQKNFRASNPDSRHIPRTLR